MMSLFWNNHGNFITVMPAIVFRGIPAVSLESGEETYSQSGLTADHKGPVDGNNVGLG